MNKQPKRIRILIADDDQDDRMMIKESMEQDRVLNDLEFVGDGEELMKLLLSRSGASGSDRLPMPDLILLDLNMPRKDGREALREIKAHLELRTIPIVVLTTSEAEEDVFRTYDLGVNSYITKPGTFAGLVHAIQSLKRYWFEIVELPGNGTGERACPEN